jgi:hypothetical protein
MAWVAPLGVVGTVGSWAASYAAEGQDQTPGMACLQTSHVPFLTRTFWIR